MLVFFIIPIIGISQEADLCNNGEPIVTFDEIEQNSLAGCTNNTIGYKICNCSDDPVYYTFCIEINTPTEENGDPLISFPDAGSNLEADGWVLTERPLTSLNGVPSPQFDCYIKTVKLNGYSEDGLDCFEGELQIGVFNANVSKRGVTLFLYDNVAMEDENLVRLSKYNPNGNLVANKRTVTQQYYSPGFTLNIGESGTSTSLSSIAINDDIGSLPSEAGTMWTPELSSTKSHGSLFLSGTLLVDFTIPTTYHLIGPTDSEDNFVNHLGDGAKIIVQSPNTLVINDINFYGCSEMWNSIIVEDGATLIVNDCEFHDGEYAVQALDGSTIVLEDVHFIDNNVGFYVPETVNNATNFISIDFQENDFKGTGRLKPSPSNPEGFDYPEAGILVNNLSYFEIKSPTDNQSSKFENLRVGIKAFKSSVVARYPDFDNMIFEEGDSGSGVGIYVNSINAGYKHFTLIGDPNTSYDHITNCKKGIVLLGTTANIKDYNITNVETGVNVTACQNRFIDITANVISNASMFGISTNWNSPFNGSIINNNITMSDTKPRTDSQNRDLNKSGINCNEVAFKGKFPVQSSSGWQIEDNTLDCKKSITGIFYRSGSGASIFNNDIFMDNYYNASNGKGNFGISTERLISSNLMCNDVSGWGASHFTSSTGINFVASPANNVICNTSAGAETSIAFDLACGGTQFKGNSMSEYALGLSLTQEAVMGGQNNNGNLWGGTDESQGYQDAVHGSQYQYDWDKSAFKVFCGAQDQQVFYNPAWCPPLVTPGNNQWIDKSAPLVVPVTFVCSSELCPDPEPRYGRNDEPDALDNSIMMGDAYDTDPALQFNSEMNLYESIQSDEYKDWNNSSRLTTFVFDQNNTFIGRFYQVKQIESAYYEQIQPNLLLIQENLANLANLQDEIWLNEEQLNTNTALTDNEIQQLNSDIESKKSTIANLLLTNENLTSNFESVKNTQITAAIGALSQLITNSIYEQNWKDIYLIHLQSLLVGELDFSSAELATIVGIANQCPVTGGDAVFFARSLYESVAPTVYDDDELCTMPQDRKMQMFEPSHDLVISPNPAKDRVTFTYKVENTAQLVIFDMMGQLIQKIDLNPNENSLEIDVSKYNLGIYQCQVKNETKVISTGKFVIIK